jgi:hypothetical protein
MSKKTRRRLDAQLKALQAQAEAVSAKVGDRAAPPADTETTPHSFGQCRLALGSPGLGG